MTLSNGSGCPRCGTGPCQEPGPACPRTARNGSDRCTCGNGEAEERRGAVLLCAVHGFNVRTEEALRISREAPAAALPGEDH